MVLVVEGRRGGGFSPVGVPGDGGRRRGGAGIPWSTFRATGQKGADGEGEGGGGGPLWVRPRWVRPRCTSCVGAVEEVGRCWERSGWGELGAGAER